MPPRVFIGTLIHSLSKQSLEILHNAVVRVDPQSGRILTIQRNCPDVEAARDDALKEGARVVCAREGVEFFFPGFVDTHIHAPQYPNAGIFGSSTLLDWLSTYTFPLEASFANAPARASRIYTAIVRRTLAHGTTAASYFATRDVEATNILADTCERLGQRAFVGRVNMDRREMCLEYYVDESTEQAVSDTRKTIAHIKDNNMARVTPVITPRFAPTSTPTLLTQLGRLAKDEDLPIQTHISENTSEIALVKTLFPEHADYASVYDAHGLLTPRTILAHAVWLTSQEADLVARRGAGVAHCACSNSSLASGAARVRWLWEKGVRVGLGTDVSGGYSPSVLEGARQASLVSRLVAVGVERDGEPEGVDEEAKLSVEEVLWLATRGGAEVMRLEDKVGWFREGMEWDAQLIGMASVSEEGDSEEDEGNVLVFGWESWPDRVAKWVFGGDDRNTKMVWVGGKLVHARGQHKSFWE